MPACQNRNQGLAREDLLSIYDASPHDERDLAEDTYVRQRIAGPRDHIGEITGFQGPIRPSHPSSFAPLIVPACKAAIACLKASRVLMVGLMTLPLFRVFASSIPRPG